MAIPAIGLEDRSTPAYVMSAELHEYTIAESLLEAAISTGMSARVPRSSWPSTASESRHSAMLSKASPPALIALIRSMVAFSASSRPDTSGMSNWGMVMTHTMTQGRRTPCRLPLSTPANQFVQMLPTSSRVSLSGTNQRDNKTACAPHPRHRLHAADRQFQAVRAASGVPDPGSVAWSPAPLGPRLGLLHANVTTVTASPADGVNHHWRHSGAVSPFSSFRRP